MRLPVPISGILGGVIFVRILRNTSSMILVKSPGKDVFVHHPRASSTRSVTRAVTGESSHDGNGHVFGRNRDVDPKFMLLRKSALHAALADQGMNATSLLTDSTLEGSSALKVYSTFLRPRPSKIEQARAEPLEPAAQRVATQIAFLVRHRRAQLTDYVRNKDLALTEKQKRGLVIQPLVLVLDNVRSAYNVGSILRTAETSAVAKVLTCGFTPTPPHEKVRKTATGADETVPTTHYMNTFDAVNDLKRDGYTIVGCETTSRSQSYVDVTFPAPTALVLGNEVTGVDPAVLDECDMLVEIPTFGLKNSLNVASACPVIVFEVLRQWGAFKSAPNRNSASYNK